MNKRTQLVDVDSDISEESVEEIIATKSKDKRERSWVYLHSEKREIKGQTSSTT
jgi:hypothetical protein